MSQPSHLPVEWANKHVYSLEVWKPFKAQPSITGLGKNEAERAVPHDVPLFSSETSNLWLLPEMTSQVEVQCHMYIDFRCRIFMPVTLSLA
jgi:hypothetical protein